jgi:murein DD-endopeptidase MepM/ murein hydrolase activator NlpD
MPSPRYAYPSVLLLPFLLVMATLVACSSDDIPTATMVPAASDTAVPEPSATAAASPTAVASPTVAAPSPTATRAPVPTATTAPSGPISFAPARLDQGGTTTVYLNQPASTATLRFGGRNYPMAQDGNRWWAVIGVGAWASTGDAPVSVTYTPPGEAQQTASGTITIVAHSYPVENIDLDPATSALLDPAIVNAEVAFRSNLYAGYSTEKLWSGPFVRPSAAAIGDIYGIARGYNGAPPTSYHTGTDFVANQGDPVVAAAAGRVVYAGELKVRGNSVIIDHGMGVFTAYHHFSQIDVAQGQMVSAGQMIGRVGSTGLVTGPHLHWEVIIRGIEVDGENWLQGRAFGP